MLWCKKKTPIEPPIKEEVRFSRYTVHHIRCEKCKKPLKDGDLLFTYIGFRGDKKVSEETIMAHADCLVEFPHYIDPITKAIHWENNTHPRALKISKEEYLAWKAEYK